MLKFTSEWFSVNERLPEIGELVLVCTSPFGNVFGLDNICDHGGWLKNSYANDQSKSTVLYWSKIVRPEIK